MKRKKLMIAGALVAGFLFVAVVGLRPVEAQEAALMGTVATTDGVPAKSYPVIIKGMTASGEHYNSFVTTDDKGAFLVKQLPPGKYTATPAGQPDSVVDVSIPEMPWFKFWQTQETKNIGKLSVEKGYKPRLQ